MTGRVVAGLILALLVAAVAGCGASGGDTSVASAPADPEAPASGTLSVFAYQDTVTDELLEPFREQNPDLDVRTATFASDEEAAAKMAGGFEADVVEVCLDEMRPLQARGLLRPIDPSGVQDWDQLVFRDSPGVRDGEEVNVVPLSAGPQGLIYDAAALEPGQVDSFADLFDAQFAGRVALEGDYPLPAIAETALTLGMEDPMNLSSDQLEQVSEKLDSSRDQFRSLWRSDADLVNLFRSGEIVVSDGGPGVAQRIRDTGVDARWVAPSERPLSWVCGLAITNSAQNADAAYRLINWQASAKAQAIRAADGYVVTNPDSIPLVAPKWRRTADPASISDAIAETEPPDYEQWVRTFREFEAQ
jgi:spermidine/putrescine-binding protein